MSKKLGFWVVAISLLVLMPLAFFIVKNNQSYQNTSFAMDTVIDMKIRGKNPQKTAENIKNTLTSFENATSMYLDNSYISQINSKAGQEFVQVDDDTYQFLKRSFELCNQSNGMFDITIGPLVKKWNISGESHHIPAIDNNILSLINYKDIIFDDANKSVMLKHSGQMIDLGGIAKGYISDKVYDILKSSEVKEAAISLGGNVIVYGDKSYNVGIKHPRQQDSLIATVNLKDTIVSTTGDYERFFEQDGKRYHHILNPKTGNPHDSDFYSVTVIGKDGAMNDFLSTKLFMTPKDELIKLLDTYQIIAFGKDNVVYCSGNLDLKLLDSSFKIFNQQG